MPRVHTVRMIAAVTVIGVLAALLTDLSGVARWLDGLSDAAWWEALPWALLVLLWLGIGVRVYRRRR